MRLFILSLLLLASNYFRVHGQSTQIPQTIRDTIALLADEIAADNVVETEYIGSKADLSKQYVRFAKIVELASDTILMDLTDHASPAVRVYAYYGLTRKNPSLLVESLRNHPDDTAAVSCQNGTLSYESRVFDEAIAWADEFLVRGNPRGLTRDEKLFVHDEYLRLMAYRRELEKRAKEAKKEQ